MLNASTEKFSALMTQSYVADNVEPTGLVGENWYFTGDSTGLYSGSYPEQITINYTYNLPQFLLHQKQTDTNILMLD